MSKKWTAWFQFPSNGKAYPKCSMWLIDYIRWCLFQFPSNGKAYPKIPKSVKGWNTTKVSIPFKRESLSKATTKIHARRQASTSFNSLQTGKPIQRPDNAGNVASEGNAFQFPSNGKAYPKQCDFCVRESHHGNVSIPFKRESLSKDGSVSMPRRHTPTFMFQFPSNGKAYPKTMKMIITIDCLYPSFNSLQTGKPIQSEILDVLSQDRITDGFQFPSNGKAYPKIERWKDKCNQ